MNFFEHQERAKHHTTLLVVYFAIAVIGIVVAVDAIVVGYLVSQNIKPSTNVYIWTSSIVLGLIGLGTIAGMAKVGNNAASIAESMGGVRISPSTKEPSEIRLLNVVQEMSIASGINVPPIYILPDHSINAFAAGLTPNTAVIAVTRGALSILNRDALQGVIAHEFSHVFNGDMRLNVRLIGILNGILLLAIIGRVLMRTRGRKNPLPLFGLGLFLVGYIGIFISRIIKSAVSRQREFLADASAVQFTRNPLGLRDALIKIKTGGSIVDNPKTEEISHLFFAEGLTTTLTSLFATHPPLDERIRALDPSYSNGNVKATATAAQNYSENPTLSPLASATETATRPLDMPTPITVRTPSPAMVTASIAKPSVTDVAQASALRAGLPSKITLWLTETSGAKAVVYALLVNSDVVTEKRQHLILETSDASSLLTVKETVNWLREARLTLRLPLVSLAIPALRLLPRVELDSFLATVRQLIQADNRVTPFEFATDVLLERSLHPSPLSTSAQNGNIQLPAMTVLSYLAYAGIGSNVGAADVAFRKGYEQIDPVSIKAILPWESCGPAEVREKLFILATVSPLEKQKVVAALGACILADGVATPDEWETLRAVCAVLDCPAPLNPPS